jgi:hypothetical protein
MFDENVTQSLATVKVAIVGTGTGDGGIVQNRMVLQTPEGHPNLLVKVVSPIGAILIRFVNSYLTVLVALVGAGMTTDVIPADDFVALVMACAKLSVAGAGLGALKDVVTVFSGLEKKFPLATGNV